MNESRHHGWKELKRWSAVMKINENWVVHSRFLVLSESKPSFPRSLGSLGSLPLGFVPTEKHFQQNGWGGSWFKYNFISIIRPHWQQRSTFVHFGGGCSMFAARGEGYVVWWLRSGYDFDVSLLKIGKETDGTGVQILPSIVGHE
jgi:hypothetical protein